MPLNLSEDPHRRFNILTGEWVLVSPHRMKRPWQGKQEKIIEDQRPSYDPNCYLCPGNVRASGAITPKYTSTYSFLNDFSALLTDTDPASYSNKLLRAEGEPGICKVICFSPDHSLTIPDMSVEEIYNIITLWTDEYELLGSKQQINHVQIFENKGALMGCSNPHPHGQIWAQHSIPEVVQKKSKHQLDYFNIHHRSLLSDYLQQELALGERIVTENDHFVGLVPFWAVWPYEMMIIPKRHVTSLSSLDEHEKQSYAKVLKDITGRYDRLFDISFPYSAGIHQAPTTGDPYPEWHMHMSFYPPLLRSATVKKFMVGYEMFADPQRDITAEQAAATLEAL